MDNKKIIESPVKEFPQYSQQFTSYATELFEKIAKESKVDIAQNKATCDKYYEAKKALDQYTKRKSRRRVRALIGVIVCFFLLFPFLLFALVSKGGTRIILFVFAFLSFCGFIAFLVVYCSKQKNNDTLLQQYSEEANRFQAEASTQMAPLWNRIYPNRADELIRKVLPIITIDFNFDINRYAYRVKKFGFPRCEKDQEATVLFSKSGRINGNPFLFLREKYHHDERKTYSGQRTVMVRRRYTDSKGHSHYTTTPEVLVAYHSEPAPFYDLAQTLVFGNEASPDLTFSRTPVLKNGDLSNLKKIIKRNNKALDKESEKQRMDDDPNTNFQKMSNDEFDSLFFATDRNNEVQFRLLFTPLAQRNRLDLIKTSPYGDDFCFYKQKMLNFILTDHSLQYSVDFDCGGQYIFDFNVRRDQFVSTRQGYFKSFYFQLAPLLCIPLYQQLKPFEYIYGREYGFAVSPYDHEAMANRVPPSFLRPEGASTDRILKSKYLRSVADFDIIEIQAISYHANPQTILVPKIASDGDVYNVPVNYFTYTKVTRKTCYAIRKTASMNSVLSDRLNKKGIRERISSIDTPGTLIYNNDEIIFGVKSNNQGLDNVLQRLSDILQMKGEKSNE